MQTPIPPMFNRPTIARLEIKLQSIGAAMARAADPEEVARLQELAYEATRDIAAVLNVVEWFEARREAAAKGQEMP